MRDSASNILYEVVDCRHHRVSHHTHAVQLIHGCMHEMFAIKALRFNMGQDLQCVTHCIACIAYGAYAPV